MYAHVVPVIMHPVKHFVIHEYLNTHSPLRSLHILEVWLNPTLKQVYPINLTSLTTTS